MIVVSVLQASYNPQNCKPGLNECGSDSSGFGDFPSTSFFKTSKQTEKEFIQPDFESQTRSTIYSESVTFIYMSVFATTTLIFFFCCLGKIYFFCARIFPGFNSESDQNVSFVLLNFLIVKDLYYRVMIILQLTKTISSSKMYKYR